MLSPAPALANILGVRGMKSLQPEADGISRLLSANGRNSNGSQEIAEGDFLKTNTGDYRMKILVIGGTGNVGGEVVKELQKCNADIRLLVLFGSQV